MRKSLSISVVGLGKLGLPFVAFYAQKYPVYGFDMLKEKTLTLSGKGKIFFVEPKVNDLLKKNRTHIHAATSITDAVVKSDITFVIVATPSDSKGSFSLRYVLSAMAEIGRGIKNKTSRHTVVLVSTVVPGSVEGSVIKELEKTAQKKVGGDMLGFCYSPEFIALGSVIENLSKPDFILIGESDKTTSQLLSKIKLSLCTNNPPVRRMNYVNAELAKIAANSFITMKISFANLLARMCERLPGGDVDKVTECIGLDPRIGNKYFKGSVSFGGPCYPRDNSAFAYSARKIGVSSQIPLVIRSFNKEQNRLLLKIVLKEAQGGKKVGIYGLSYKPGIDVITESPGLFLASELVKKKQDVMVFDSLAMSEIKRILGVQIDYADSFADIWEKVDILVVPMPDMEFKKKPLHAFAAKNSKAIIDCWRVRQDVEKLQHVRYIPFGKDNR